MDISVTFKGGGSFVNLKPAFSATGDNVFVASKSSITQYNTKTGKQVFEYTGWESDIVGLNFSTINNLECIVACSKDGKLLVWSIKNKIKVVEYKIPKNTILFFSLLTSSLTNGLDILIAYNTKKRQIGFAALNTKELEQQRVCLKITREDFHIDVSKKNFFSVVSKNVVHFATWNSVNISFYNMAENNRNFTCVACHCEEQIVLTGDDTGRVILWQNIFKKKSQAVFHWHTLPVKCIAFSTLGSYFYSGADECVLVKWQIDNPNQKKFLPRLPAGLVQLAVSENNAYVAVATSDNAIRIVDSQMNQICVIQNLVLGSHYESGMIYDPITRALVMNGNVGCVQFYSPNDMSLLYNVDIVNQNKITNERDCKLENTDVKKIALSKNGKWLATIEERKEKKICKEVRLKFWTFNRQKQMYELNTSIEYPHEATITSIALQPVTSEDSLKCITVADDRTFKIWQLGEIISVHRTGLIWNCINVGTFRDISCHGLSFSIDGSLFAVGFDAILTIWATDGCELKSSLIHSNFKEKINFIQFGQGNQCHLVVSASKNQLSVWNILSLTITWVVSLKNIKLLVSDPLSTYMMVVCKYKSDQRTYNKMIVFEPSSSKILFSTKEIKGICDKIISAAFVPSVYSNDTRLKWYERTNLYFMTNKNELYCISKSEEPRQYMEDSNQDLSEEMSVFSKMKPHVAISQVQKASKYHQFTKKEGVMTYREFLETPIETLPPIRLVAASLLQSLVLQRKLSTNLSLGTK
ncbi:WD repeat-containing protein 75 [Anthonomus grandis grandis]|uniref:WD repeat-containing protein 75 n=1 Tax=Anthonomus grandis grandis TaxID=2921223 RepID=UPI0021653880|nr:WD repeat-containing protein 75 [Anthonomus grandis grandis]